MYNNHNNNPKERLDDIMTAGIYEYYRTDNDEVVYRGSSGSSLVDLDRTHREGQKWIKGKGKDGYYLSPFRANLRREIGKILEARWIHEHQTMTRRELLSLERDSIQEKTDQRQCCMNWSDDPLQSWLDNNP
jgi:hypothetical protein